MEKGFEVERDFSSLADEEVQSKFQETAILVDELELESNKLNRQLFLARQQKGLLLAEIYGRDFRASQNQEES